jgi:hypothetical protein
MGAKIQVRIKEGPMYIRTREEALDNLADILALPERRDQIIQSTVRIMLCLEVEPRLFLADCQALLIEGGLETLRSRRRDAVEAAEDLPVVVLDPDEDKLFEEVASALDALRFAGTVRQVFPGIRADRWQLARALLLYESGVREQVTAGVKAHGDAAKVAAAREGLEILIAALRPAWSDRVGAIRGACLETLKRTDVLDPDRLHEEAERLFEVFASSDQRAPQLLDAIDTDAAHAEEQISRIREMADAARKLQEEPPPPPPGQVKDVA